MADESARTVSSIHDDNPASAGIVVSVRGSPLIDHRRRGGLDITGRYGSLDSTGQWLVKGSAVGSTTQPLSLGAQTSLMARAIELGAT